MLTSVDRVQMQRGMTRADTQLLKELIQEASDELRAECSRGFERVVGITERVAGFGTPFLMLTRALPLVSIASIEFEDTLGQPSLIEATGYQIVGADEERYDAGLIRRLGLNWAWTANVGGDITRDQVPGTERRAYKVVYTGGWVTRKQESEVAFGSGVERNLPFDIERAIVDQVVAMFRAGGRDPTVSSKRNMSTATSYGAGGQGGDRDAPPHWAPSFTRVVTRYRR